MNRKILLMVFMLSLSETLVGQSDGCEMGRIIAEGKISRGMIYFPRLTVESTQTLRKMLEIDYGIMDELYDDRNDIALDGELECFYKVMKKEIEKRWGRSFLRKQRQIANSIDHKGIGYVAPKENGISDSIVAIIKKHAFEMKLSAYLVLIKISPEKEVLDLLLLHGVPVATELPKADPDYQILKKVIQEVDKVFEPGYMRGKKIPSTLMFWIELGG